MNKITIQCALCGMLAALVVVGMPVQQTDACTRAVYLGPEDTIITVRSMDWKGDTKTNLWAFMPRGKAQRLGFVSPFQSILRTVMIVSSEPR